MERHEAITVIVAKFFQERRDVNPYASAETMRSLDQVIRTGLADGLARAASAWRSVYQQQSRTMGVPTRERPFPDPAEMAKLRGYKQMGDTLSGMVSQVHALEAPANDRVYHRIRDNDQLLELLIAADYQLTTLAESIDRLAETLNAGSADGLEAEFQAKVDALGAAIRERARILSQVP
ncbi:MAG: hypothetical protein M1272_06025 [Firmicutes bacterium]|nr:hypothetical protein [Bacillota bacterium]